MGVDAIGGASGGTTVAAVNSAQPVQNDSSQTIQSVGSRSPSDDHSSNLFKIEPNTGGSNQSNMSSSDFVSLHNDSQSQGLDIKKLLEMMIMLKMMEGMMKIMQQISQT